MKYPNLDFLIENNTDASFILTAWSDWTHRGLDHVNFQRSHLIQGARQEYKGEIRLNEDECSLVDRCLLSLNTISPSSYVILIKRYKEHLRIKDLRKNKNSYMKNWNDLELAHKNFLEILKFALDLKKEKNF